MAELTATERMRAALQTDGQTFTREQVGHIISLLVGDSDQDELTWHAGYHAGYWARVAEENAAYPPPRHDVLPSGAENAIRDYRKRMGVDVVLPRAGDFPGLGVEAVRRLKGREVS